MRHSGRKSFSDSLVLDDSDKGAVIVKSIRPDSSTDIGLKEGDEIVGATIHFDKLKKNEVLRVLKLIEPFDKNMRVLTKQDLKASGSCGTLNNHIASPKEMLKDSYSRLFHNKVQKFLNREPFLCDAAKTSDVKIGDLNGQLFVPGAKLHLDGASLCDDIDGPAHNLSNMSAKTPDFRDPMPHMGLSSKLKEPNVQDIVKCPEVNLSGQKSKSRDMELNLKINNIKGGIDMLDDSFNDTQGPELDLKTPAVDLKSLSKKCLPPTLPKFGISGPKVKSLEVGIDDLETSDFNLLVPKIKGEINAPELGVNMPKAEFNSPKIDMKTPDLDIDAPSGKFTMPKFSLSGPKVKGPDFGIDAGLEPPDLSPTAPKIKQGIQAPDIGLNLPSARMKRTELNVDVPDVDRKSPSQQFKFPTLPKFGIPGPKMKCPEVDIDGGLGTPDLNLLAPKIKGEINAPELGEDLPKAQFNSPKIDMKTPNHDIDAPSGKSTISKFSLSGPKVKGPDFGIDAGLKTPDLSPTAPKIKQGITAPDIGLNLPSARMKRTELNVDVPNVELKSPSWQFKFPTLPKFGISGPKVKRSEVDIDGDLETPDLNLLAPKIKGEINAPELGEDLPKAQFNSPKIDMKTPQLDTDSPSGKFTMPKFSLSGPNVKGPDFGVDAGLKTPDLNLTVPKIKGGIKAPDIGLNLPSAHMKGTKLNGDVPDVDLKSPSRQFKFPTLPKFGISGPKMKCPEVDIDGGLGTPDLNLLAPKSKGKINAPELGEDLPKAQFNSPKIDMKKPNLDIDASSGKFTIPKFSLSGPKVKGPDFGIDAGLKTPDLSPTAPKIKQGITAPDIGLNLPSARMKRTELNVDVPNVELKSPSWQFKFPTLPKFGISGPKVKRSEVDIDGDLETLDLNLSAPKIKGKNIAPELGEDLPKAQFNSSKIDMKTPQLDTDSPSGKFTMPKFSLSGPNVKGPDFGIDADLKTPDLNLTAPKIKGGIKAPDIGLNLPSAHTKGTKLNGDVSDVDLKSPSRQFKFPTLPKLGISGRKIKCPEVDIDGGLGTPDLNLLAPKIKGEINAPELGEDLPKAQFNSPKIGMKTPDLDTDAPSGEFAKHNFSLSGPNVEGTDFDIDAGLKTHDLNLTAPKIKEGIKAPDIGLHLPSADMKGPKFDLKIPDVDLKTPSWQLKFPTLPKFGISGPKVKRSEVDIDGDLETPDLNLSAFKIKGKNIAPVLGVDLPKADFHSPKLDTTTPDHDIDVPSRRFAKPKFPLSGPKGKGPDFDIDAVFKTPELNLTAPKFKGGIKAADLNLPSTHMKGPKLDLKATNVDHKSSSKKITFPTLPELGIFGPNVKYPEIVIDGNLDKPAPEIKGKINAPDFSVDLHKDDFNSSGLEKKMLDLDMDAPSGKFTIPKFIPSGTKVIGSDWDIAADTKTPYLNLTAPKIKGKVGAPELGVDLAKADFYRPKVDLKTPYLDIDAPSEKFNMSKFNLSGPKVNRPDFDVETGLETPDLNLTTPKMKGRIKTPKVDVDLRSGDMKALNLHLKSRMIKGEIISPDVIKHLPQSDLKESTLKLNTPHFNHHALSGKLNMPALKKPKYGLSELNMNRKQLDIDEVFDEANLSKIKTAINTNDVDHCFPKNGMKNTQFSLQASNNDGTVHTGKMTMPTVMKMQSGSSGSSIKEKDLYVNLKPQDAFVLTSNIKADLTTSDTYMNSPKADLKGQEDVQIQNPNQKIPSVVGCTNLPKGEENNFEVSKLKTCAVNTNMLCAPDIYLEVPGGTLKRSKLKQKTFI